MLLFAASLLERLSWQPGQTTAEFHLLVAEWLTVVRDWAQQAPLHNL